MAKTFKQKLIELGFPDQTTIRNLANFCKSSNSGFILFSFENTGDPDTSTSDCTVSGTPQIYSESILGIATLASKQIINAGINDGSLPPSAIDNEELIDKYMLLYFVSLINGYFGDSINIEETLNGFHPSQLS